jgi:hypothetical protein
MGADLHMHVEVYRGDTGWVRAEEMVPNDLHEHFPDDEPAMERADWFHGRNYVLFGMLGYDRGRVGIEPIVAPRGLPSDVSDEVKAHSDEYGVDGHSHSWLTLRELMCVDWQGRTSTQRAWFHLPRELADAEEWVRDDWRKRTCERLAEGMYSGFMSESVVGEGIVAQHLDGEVTYGTTGRGHGPLMVVRSDRTPNVYEIEWTTSWATMAGAQWFQFLAKLGRLAFSEGTTLEFPTLNDQGNLTFRKIRPVFVPRSVRVVFFFDN